MAEKKNKGLGLPQTKGNFQIRGKVTGTEKNNFYTEKQTKTDRQWRAVSFGLEVAPEETVYATLNGMEKDSVYFFKRAEEKGQKGETREIAWKDRFNFKQEGFRMIGVNCGITKTVNDKGKPVNDNKMLTDYDACKLIASELKDDVSVFVKGSIDFSTYGEGKHATKFVPSQISLAKDVDFEVEDFVPMADFVQTIIYMGVTANDDQTKFTVAAKVVKYDSIEDVEFVIENKGLANTFRKKLKPYTAIQVSGNIRVSKDIEEVESEEDYWGERNSMTKINTPTTRELVITGADVSTIDVETYTESIIDQAIESMKASKTAEQDYGGSDDDWGSVGKIASDDEDSAW